MSDPEGEYEEEGFRVIKSAYELVRFAKAHHLKGWCIAFEPQTEKDFDNFCTVAFAESHSERRLTVVVDELSDVTTIAKAPPKWGKILRRIRKYGGKVRAGTQSPAEADKTLLRQKSMLWCGMMETPLDREYVHKQTGIPMDALESLRGDPHFDCIVKVSGKQWELINANRT